MNDACYNLVIKYEGGYSMNFPTHIVSAGGIVEDDQGNILLVKTQHNG